MSDPHLAPPPRTARWVTVLLVVSLSLNVVVAGLAIGALLRGPAPWTPSSAGPSGELRLVERALPEETRRAFRRALMSRGADLRSASRELRRLRRETIEVLRAEEYDREALAAIFARQSELWLVIGEGVQASLLEQVDAMTLDERQRFADSLEAVSERLRNNRPGASKE